MAAGATDVDRADSGTTQMAHMLGNVGATRIRFTPAELAELNQPVRAINVRGARLPMQC
jgi:aryl-alcohol dehydrogenase-like predicted oxidoreductase